MPENIAYLATKQRHSVLAQWIENRVPINEEGYGLERILTRIVTRLISQELKHYRCAV